jgi:hypothetical protein
MFSQNFRYLFTPVRLESWTVYEVKQSQTQSLYVYGAVQFGKFLPTFRGNFMPTFPAPKQTETSV